MDIPEQQRRLREQLEGHGIADRRVLAAMQSTRRDLFVMPEDVEDAYADTALPIEAGQTISQPYIVARMTEALELTGDETVLEIGTGSGYQTAVLAQLCRRVVTVERFPELAEPARRLLDSLGYANVEFHVGDGTLGWPADAPYDGVLVTAAAPDVPAPLYNQLRFGGRLVIPVGDAELQTLQRIERHSDGPRVESLCQCKFVKLVGDAGWIE
jgi:protein-L-isoaspartate(D-aspartate) O-methyltransferase